tara:strand:- start:209 stop:445 length:237 start_codon:yes stop_codon:yes gene_type:complete
MNQHEDDLGFKAFYWCIHNKIKIYPKPIERGPKPGAWNIIININGKEHKSPEQFLKSNLNNKIIEYYIYYYEKYGLNK